jgi:hypothetical protein
MARPPGSGPSFSFDRLWRLAARLKWLWITLAILFALGAVVATAGGVYIWQKYLTYVPAMPERSALFAVNRAPGIRFLDRQDRLIATRGPRYGQRITLTQLPAHVPKAFLHDAQGKLTGMSFEIVKAEYDAKGRRNLVPTGEPDVVFDCDEVLIAVGQENAFPWIERDSGIEFDRWGLPVLGETTFQCSVPRVFFGGDAAFGPKNIITAVAHGHEAAVSIDRFLSGEDVATRPSPMATLQYLRAERAAARLASVAGSAAAAAGPRRDYSSEVHSRALRHLVGAAQGDFLSAAAALNARGGLRAA